MSASGAGPAARHDDGAPHSDVSPGCTKGRMDEETEKLDAEFWRRISQVQSKAELRDGTIHKFTDADAKGWRALKASLCRDLSTTATAARVVAAADTGEGGLNLDAEGLPCVVQGLGRNWPAMNGDKKWSIHSFAKRFPHSEFRLSDTRAATIRMADFAAYCARNRDKLPMAVYDSAFAERKGEPEVELAEEYTVPAQFRDDLFNYYYKRPPFRWILMAPERSGTGIHLDPLHTSAWLTLFQGRKIWAFFPPDTDPAAIGGPHRDRSGRFVPAVPSLRFFSEVRPRLLRQGVKGMQVALQFPGDTVYVPPGWWHVVLNLEDSLSLTHNYLSRDACDVRVVWRELCAAQPCFAGKWFSRLLIYEKALAKAFFSAHLELREQKKAVRARGVRWDASASVDEKNALPADAESICDEEWHTIDSALPTLWPGDQRNRKDSFSDSDTDELL